MSPSANPFMTLGEIEPPENPFDVLLSDMDPDEQRRVAARIQQLAGSSSNAPTGKGATMTSPVSTLDIVSTRFDNTRIPISRLLLMRRDPIMAFAGFFVLAQLTRARYMMKSVDPQAAAFADNALRRIYGGLVAMFVEKLFYGYQAGVKRFGRSQPDWTYIDPADPSGGERRVWDNGSIQATIWKPFAALHPMAADPIWNDADGSFNGIRYSPKNIYSRSTFVGTNGDESQDYDVLQSLWFTNELESVFGSLWGYPRSGYAYRFWWSFWFDWGLADRHFEKDADPPIRVYYPPNKPSIDGRTPRELAIMIGDRARSNSTIALPGDVIDKMDGTGTSMREWEVDFLRGGGNFEVFKDRFDQVATFMFQAMMIPPDTFQAKGGTAGYNSTSNLLDAFMLSQKSLMDDLDFVINEYMLPQLLVANGFEAKVTKVTKGFDSTDVELAKSLLTGISNANSDILGRIDWNEMLDIVGIPRLSLAEINAKKDLLPATAPMRPDEQRPTNDGMAAVTPGGLYYRPREIIRLADDRRDLPIVAHLDDIVVYDNTERLRDVWLSSIESDYQDAAVLLTDYKGNDIALDETFFERWWRRATDRAQATAAQTRRVLASIMRRASTIEMDQAGLRNFAWDPSFDDGATRYLAERGADLVTGISQTTRDEIRRYLSELQARGVDPDHMPDLVRTHFALFAGTRADRLVRTEVGRAYNMATLFAAQDAGIQRVRARDAQLGESRSDPHCIRRNGKIFTIPEAFVETEKEHPNGTLQWEIIA